MKTIFAAIASALTIGAPAAQAGMGWKNGSTLQGIFYQGVNMQGTVYQGTYYQATQYQGSQYQGAMRQGSQMQGAIAGQITIGSDNLVSIELPR